MQLSCFPSMTPEITPFFCALIGVYLTPGTTGFFTRSSASTRLELSSTHPQFMSQMHKNRNMQAMFSDWVPRILDHVLIVLCPPLYGTIKLTCICIVQVFFDGKSQSCLVVTSTRIGMYVSIFSQMKMEDDLKTYFIPFLQYLICLSII